MELNLSLRSLEAAGRPSGTGRPSLPSPSREERDHDRAATARGGEDDSIASRGRATPEHEAAGKDERARRGSDDRTGHDAETRERRSTEAQRRRSERARAARDDQGDTEEAPRDELAPRTSERADFARTLQNTPRSAERGAAKTGNATQATETNTSEPSEAAAPITGSPTEHDAPVEAPEKALVAQSVDPLAALLESAAGAALVVESAPEPTTESFELAALPTEPEAADLTSDGSAVASIAVGLEATTSDSGDLGSVARPDTAIASAPPVTEARAQPTPPTAPEARMTPRLPVDDARAADILRQVRVELSPAIKEAVIQLHPAELGRISIRLTVEDDRFVARVRAEKREALDALERHLPELRAALTRQGVETQQFDLALGFHDERRANDGKSDRAARGRSNTNEEPVGGLAERSPRLRRIAGGSGIDTYA